MLNALMPVAALLARTFAPRVLDWVESNTAIPSWARPFVTELLTALFAALAARAAVKQAAKATRTRGGNQAMRTRRARKVRAGIRKALA